MKKNLCYPEKSVFCSIRFNPYQHTSFGLFVYFFVSFLWLPTHEGTDSGSPGPAHKQNNLAKSKISSHQPQPSWSGRRNRFFKRIILSCFRNLLSFPGGSVVKNLPAKVPWVGKISWRWKWQPTPLFLSGKFHGQRSLAGYSSLDHKRVRHDLATAHHHHTHTMPWCGLGNSYK